MYLFNRHDCKVEFPILPMQAGLISGVPTVCDRNSRLPVPVIAWLRRMATYTFRDVLPAECASVLERLSRKQPCRSVHDLSGASQPTFGASGVQHTNPHKWQFGDIQDEIRDTLRPRKHDSTLLPLHLLVLLEVIIVVSSSIHC